MRHKALYLFFFSQYFCAEGPNCPLGYTWVPSLGRTCLKVGNVVGGNSLSADIHSGSNDK